MICNKSASLNRYVLLLLICCILQAGLEVFVRSPILLWESGSFREKVDIALRNRDLAGVFGYLRHKYFNIWLIFSLSAMKFLIESSEKAGKQIRSSSSAQGKQNQDTLLYYNILNPSNKIQCDECKRDITKATKVMIDDTDYCCSCFANLDEFPHQYRVINKLDFPVFEQEWSADEELLLFEGLEKHGFGNWGEIADFIGSNKTREDVEDHYQHIYLGGVDFLPPGNLLSRRDQNGFLIQNNKDGAGRRQNKQPNKTVASNSMHYHRASLTVNQTSKTGNNPAEIVGFMPKRGDFEVEYDNDAELLLAEMQFNDDDTEEERAMKFRLIDIYNHKLNERIKRKEFVISRKLLDLREQIRLDKTRTKEEKEIYNMMKVFARFNTADDHEKLVQGIIKEKQLRQRIEELKQLKKKGFRTLGEVEDELQNKKKKDQKIKKKDYQIYGADKVTRRMRKDPTVEKSEKRVLYVNREEEELCKRLNMTFKQYMLMKETILRQSVRLGIISRDQTTQLFKVDRSISEAVFDFLVNQEDIIMRNNDDIQVS